MSDARLRTLKIKTGVVKRLAKEKVTYEKEVILQQEKVEKLKEQQDKDKHVIAKQEEVLQESLMMIPDCQRRLLKAFEDLKNIVDSEEDLVETDEFAEAKKVLEAAEIQVSTE